MENPFPKVNLAQEATGLLRYAGSVAVDVLLGVTFGIVINAAVLILRKKFNLSPVVEVVIQLTLIIIVLYFLDHSTLLRSIDIWDSPSSYGIVFITAFGTSQSNVLRWFEAISEAEREMVDTWLD